MTVPYVTRSAGNVPADSISVDEIADAELKALAGLTSAADKVPYFTGAGTADVADFTAAGRALVDDASAAAQRVTLSVPSITAGVSLPGSPVDGDIYVYNVDTTNGVKWMFQFRSASGSTYKWEFVGGAPLSAEVATEESTASATYAALATAGPAVTPPLAGDYEVTYGARLYNATAPSTQKMSFDIGGTGAVDGDAVEIQLVNAGGDGIHVARSTRKTALAAAGALTAKYKTDSGTLFAKTRYIKILPVRVI